jgi:5-(carboxyamino)imidazole ribonucleotide synthase
MSLPPGAWIGILGGGQLGRMLALAAAPLGYRVHIFADEADSPAAQVSARTTVADFADADALAAFGASIDVATYEFENVPVAAVQTVARHAPVCPGAAALEVAQDRVAEKRFVEQLGGRAAPWRAVDDRQSLEQALVEIGFPAILKTRRLGYDGKGQVRVDSPDDALAALHHLGGRDLVLEGLVRFESEFSLLVARGRDGAHAAWPPIANRHDHGILRTSRAPAPGLAPEHVRAARALVDRVLDSLFYVGVIACEFFATEDGPVFNEMAPRVHNSGHWTIEGAHCSQFEQHVRAIAGLPLGSTALTGEAFEMENLLGDEAMGAHALLARHDSWLHLYGKAAPAPGRKMGHVTRRRG